MTNGEFHQDTPVVRPDGVPENARYVKGQWITIENNQVYVHQVPESAQPHPSIQSHIPYAVEQMPPRDNAEISVKISAKGRAVDQLPYLFGGALAPQQQPPAIEPYAPYLQAAPMHAGYPGQAVPFVHPTFYDPIEQHPPQPFIIEPTPYPRQIESFDEDEDDRWDDDPDDIDNEDVIEDEEGYEDDYEDEYREVKRRASWGKVAIYSAVLAGLIAGPTIQAANADAKAVEICAKDGIGTILTNPFCFAGQFASNYSTDNIFNITPPENTNE